MGCAGSKEEAKNTKKKSPQKKGTASRSAGPQIVEEAEWWNPIEYCPGTSIDGKSASGTEEGDFVLVKHAVVHGEPETFTFKVTKSSVMDWGVGVAQMYNTAPEQEEEAVIEDFVVEEQAKDDEGEQKPVEDDGAQEQPAEPIGSVEAEEGGEEGEGQEADEVAEPVEQQEEEEELQIPTWNRVRTIEYYFRDGMVHSEHQDDRVDDDEREAPTHNIVRNMLEAKEGDSITIKVHNNILAVKVNQNEYVEVITDDRLSEGEWYPMINFGDPDDDTVTLQ